MGYFANGTDGQFYWETFCASCVHDQDNNCTVLLAHLLHNYEECNVSESILHMLIPLNKAGKNQKCTMWYKQPEETE